MTSEPEDSLEVSGSGHRNRNKIPEIERKMLRHKRRYSWSSGSIMRVIRVYCEHCKGNQIRRVFKCKHRRCPLWPWRLAKRKSEGFRLAQAELLPAEIEADRRLWLTESGLSESGEGADLPDVARGYEPGDSGGGGSGDD